MVKTVLTFVWLLYLIDRLGRRNLLMIGAAGGSVCMWIIGGYINVVGTKTKSTHLSSGGVAAIFFFYLWTAFYTPTWNGTPWVLNSEIFDQNTRSLGQASAAANNWFWNFIISRFTPQVSFLHQLHRPRIRTDSTRCLRQWVHRDAACITSSPV